MKFEIKPHKQSDYYFLTISKTELLKHYENNKDECFWTLNGIIEMFCAPQCFEIFMHEEELEDIVKGFKTTHKKLGFFITHDEKGHRTIGMMYIRK